MTIISGILCRCFGKSAKRIESFFLLPGLLLLICSCSTKPLTDPIIGPDHVLKNVYRSETLLPGTLKRVAVLPLSYNEIRGEGASAGEILQPVFESELTKVARFESYFVRPQQLRLWTGKERWDDFDELPAEFLKLIAERTGCDGVLFTRVTQFKAYSPIVIGWRMRLTSNGATTIWAADEIFDAADQTVANSARRYNRGRTKGNPVLEDSRSILLSPREFGQYSLATLFATIPVR